MKMNKHHSVSRILQAIFNPVIGLWSIIIPYSPFANPIITHTLNIIFVSVALAFPVVGFTYVALFALNTFGFGIDSARFASITKDQKDITSSIVHFLTGAVFITAASLVFAFCPNPFIPMLIITLLASTLNFFYIRATCLGSFMDAFSDIANIGREALYSLGLNSLTSTFNLFAPADAQIQCIDPSVKMAFNNTGLETIYLLKDNPNFVYIPN
jgi:hypothetical protein